MGKINHIFFLKKITLINWKQFELHGKTVQRVFVMMERKVNNVSDVPCCNTCSLVWVNEAIFKQGIISTSKSAHIIRAFYASYEYRNWAYYSGSGELHL